MNSNLPRLHLEKNLGIGLMVTTLALAPTLAIDPINPPKFLALVSFAALLGGQLLISKSLWDFKTFRVVYFLSLTFALLLILNLFFTSGDVWRKLFGAYGRNTGVLTYFALLTLLIVSFVAAKGSNLTKVSNYIKWTGAASLAYGLIQFIGLDPFDWSNPYSPVFGFLGNPNFHSSFVAMFAVMTFTNFLSSGNSSKVRLIYLGITLLSLGSIYTTKSQQGFLVFAAGILIPGYVFLSNRLNRIQRITAYSFVVMMGFGSILGMLQIGPLSKFLYKESVTYRGDYWNAGWRMATENPLLGVGFDQYGNWYRRFRSLEATLRRGPEMTSNAAHNVFIDFAASGGFILLCVYIAFVVLTIKAITKILKNSNLDSKEVIAIIGMWVAYQAQSVISINQIGLAIWGWVLSGLIIGYSMSLGRDDSSKNDVTKNVGPRIKSPSVQTLGASQFMFSLLFFLVGAVISAPVLLSSINYKNALESSNQEKIVASAFLKPYEETRMGEVALILNQNNLNKESLALTQKIVARYPDSFEGWRLINQLSPEGSEEKAQAIREMKRLDPLNPDIQN